MVRWCVVESGWLEASRRFLCVAGLQSNVIKVFHISDRRSEAYTTVYHRTYKAHARASEILANRIHLGRVFRETRFAPAPRQGVNPSLWWGFYEVGPTSDRSVCDLALVHHHRLASVRQEIQQRLLDILLRLMSASVLGADGESFAFAIASFRGHVNIVLPGMSLAAMIVRVLVGWRAPVVLGMAWSTCWSRGGGVEGSAV